MTRFRRLAIVALSLAALTLALTVALTVGAAAGEEEPFIIVASTTSTKNSGLFDYLLPRFEAKTGIDVRVVAFGTGAALRLARMGDADVLLVHHTPSEEAFVAAGYGLQRHDLMYNDFLLVGPLSDPTGIKDTSDVVAALRHIAAGRANFLSRGDDSGTHKRERALWREAAIAVGEASGTWYREAGAGMGATLNMAAALGAYTLSDRGTWLSFKNRRDLIELSAGDRRLVNQYGVILVNPERHPHTKAKAGARFIAWLLSSEGQQAIGSFRINGEVLFHPGRARK